MVKRIAGGDRAWEAKPAERSVTGTEQACELARGRCLSSVEKGGRRLDVGKE